MHVPLGGESPGGESAGREKRGRKPAKIPLGTIVAAKVTNMHATHAGVELESGARPGAQTLIMLPFYHSITILSLRHDCPAVSNMG